MVSEYKYIALSWDYVENLCRRVAFDILRDGYRPTSVVALAKGGVFAGNILSDYLGVEKLQVVDINRDEVIHGRKILLVDDFVNTGNTIKRALSLIQGEEVRTASLLLLEKSEFIPDYFGDYLSDYGWIIFPWNFVEDVSKLIVEILGKGEKAEGRDVNTGEGAREELLWISQPKLKRLLGERGLNPLNLEITFPGRFEEVLEVLELRGIVKKRVDERRVYWRLIK